MKTISICERLFISNCILKKQKRLDGRNLLEGRTLEIVFGKERGCCMVLQGNTRVLAQVSAEVTEPKASTPTEGILHINLELSAMAAPDMKSQTRSSDEAVEAQRLLERCIRDSNCIDLESLCIVTGSKVWTIRVDIHTLNDEGNLIECASIAAVSALAHFRRPDVIVVGTDVTVHSVEGETVALNLHHMPICVNLAIFDQGKYILVDPIEIEEKVADGCYYIGMNAHQEICFVHRRGVLLLKEDVIQRCEDIAVKHAQEVTQSIRAALDDDAYKRLTNASVGFTNLIQTGIILGAKQAVAEFSLDTIKNIEVNVEPDVIEVVEENEDSANITENECNTFQHIPSTAKERAMHILQESEVSVFEGGPSKWGGETDEESSEEENGDTKQNLVKEEINLDSEEETVFVDKDQVDIKPESSRRWYSKDPFM